METNVERITRALCYKANVNAAQHNDDSRVVSYQSISSLGASVGLSVEDTRIALEEGARMDVGHIICGICGEGSGLWSWYWSISLRITLAPALFDYVERLDRLRPNPHNP